MIVVHLLVHLLWSGIVATILSLATVATIVWLVATIGSFGRLPVLIGEGRLVWRLGTLRKIDVPLADVAGLRASWDSAALKDRAVLNLALIAYPNIVVELKRPVSMPRGRMVDALAHRLDDPEGFRAALQEELAG